MTSDVNRRLRRWAERGEPVGAATLLDRVEARLAFGDQMVLTDSSPRPPRPGWAVALAAAALVALVVGLVAVVDPFGNKPSPVATQPDSPVGPVVPRDAVAGPLPGLSLPTGGTPVPDIAGATAGDDGSGPLPLGTGNEVPGTDRLDFLFEFCWSDCYRDAHWMDPDNPQVGSGVWTAGRPFHVRHGFINNEAEPLGEGFDVVLYVTALDEPGEFGGVPTGTTVRYTSDYVLRGTSDRCGPTYKTQAEPQTCEWFVHEFPEGLPAGRFAIWAVWEAPCRAWVDLGLTDVCDDPHEVISLFSSGFDAPYGTFGPGFDEPNQVQMTADEVSAWLDQTFGVIEFGEPVDPSTVDAGDIIPSGDYPEATGPSQGDPAYDLTGARLPLGERSLPDNPRLDFHNVRCWATCFRDAVVVDPADEQMGIGVWAAGAPFHIRHGFVNEAEEPLGDQFDAVVSVTRRSGPQLDDGAFPLGHTYRFASDYVVRGVASACGPDSWNQTEPGTCEWFVHDFPEGLPAGRYDLWVEWYAPCSAWQTLGLADDCTDPNEVSSRFASSVNMPFYSSEYPEGMPPPFDPATLFAEDPQPILRNAFEG